MVSLKNFINSPIEENVQRYLTKHSEILVSAFCPMLVANREENSACIPKFRFGSEYVSDFIIVTCGSFVCDTILIELEPPTAMLFTKSGSFAQRLNGAHQQVVDWLSWIDQHRDYFRASVVNELKKQSKCELASVIDGTQHPRLVPTAKIIIGRRHMLSETDDRRRAELYQRTSRTIEVLPYDRLIDIEEAFDK